MEITFYKKLDTFNFLSFNICFSYSSYITFIIKIEKTIKCLFKIQIYFYQNGKKK